MTVLSTEKNSEHQSIVLLYTIIYEGCLKLLLFTIVRVFLLFSVVILSLAMKIFHILKILYKVYRKCFIDSRNKIYDGKIHKIFQWIGNNFYSKKDILELNTKFQNIRLKRSIYVAINTKRC